MSYRPSYERGSWKADCDRCGFTYKSRQLKLEWTGLRTCNGPGTENCWEPRQPQDHVRGIPDKQSPPWTRPQPDAMFVSSVDLSFTSGATATVAENVSDATTIYTAAATSGAGGSITFTLFADVDGLFEITTAGVLTLQTGKNLDFDVATSHSVTIKADDGTSVALQGVTITVTDA